MLIKRSGRQIAYVFMRFVVLWYMLFCPQARLRCRPYLIRRVGKNGLSIANYRWICSLGKTLIDRAAYGILSPGTLKIDVPQGQDLQDLLNEGDGLIVLSAHVGCWQVAFSELMFLDRPVHIVMYRDQADVDKHYYEHSAKHPLPFHVIDPSGFLGGTLEMTNVVQQGQVLGLMGDRVFGEDKNTVIVDFLGGKIALPVAAYRLAAMRNTPIAVVFSYKAGPNVYHVELAGTIRVTKSINRNNSTSRRYAQEFANLLEKFTERHPFDFFNFYDMWAKNTKPL